MPDGGGEIISIIVFVVVIATALFMSTGVVSDIHVQFSSGDGVQQSDVVVVTDSDTERIADTVGKHPVVKDSRGLALSLAGTPDSYAQTTADISIASDNTWTVSTWLSVDAASQNTSMTAVSLDGRVVVGYNASQSAWVAWYYSESSTHSYEVSIAAPSPTMGLTNVMVVSNGSHMAIYRNNTRGEVADLGTSSIVDAPVSASSWNGRLDELRTFDMALNASWRSSVVGEPVDGLPGTARTARVMFDEQGAKSQLVLFADARLATSNASWVDGLEGHTMTEGVDYSWDTIGPTVTVLDSGDLADDPVLYVDWVATSPFGTFADEYRTLLNMSGVLFASLGGIVVLFYLVMLRGR